MGFSGAISQQLSAISFFSCALTESG